MSSLEKSSLLLIHRRMNRTVSQESVDIVVSPQFYTLKREEIPVKYEYQAKKVAPSVFDGILDIPAPVSYFVYREEKRWVFIAYNMQEILDFLEEKGIAPQRVRKIFFAQQFASSFHGVVRLGEKEALMKIGEDIAVVPTSGIENTQFDVLDSSTLPKKWLRPQTSGVSLFNTKQALWLAAIFAVFGIVWFAEGTRYTEAVDVLKDQRISYDIKYPAMGNSYTRNSILKKYRNIDIRERRKRDVVRRIFSVLSSGVTLQRMDIGNKSYSAQIAVSSNAVSIQLDTLLKQAGLTKERTDGKTVYIKGTL